MTMVAMQASMVRSTESEMEASQPSEDTPVKDVSVYVTRTGKSIFSAVVVR